LVFGCQFIIQVSRCEDFTPTLILPPSRGRRIATEIASLAFGKLAITEKDGFPLPVFTSTSFMGMTEKIDGLDKSNPCPSKFKTFYFVLHSAYEGV